MTAMSTAITRQIVLDTETTGMNQIGAHYEGHKIIEIGAVEVINRRLTGNNFHVYLKPDRLVDPQLEKARLENGREKAGEKCRPLAAAGRRAWPA